MCFLVKCAFCQKNAQNRTLTGAKADFWVGNPATQSVRELNEFLCSKNDSYQLQARFLQYKSEVTAVTSFFTI